MAELKKVRNIKPGFKRGLWFGMFNAAWETAVGGHSPWTLRNTPDWRSLDKVGQHEEPKRDYVERTLPPRDRLQGVYYAATEHDEDQPWHLKVADFDVCATRCVEEYDNPAPASARPRSTRWSRTRRRSTASACTSTRPTACTARPTDIKDPYQIIDWVTPEGGSGPNYQNL